MYGILTGTSAPFLLQSPPRETTASIRAKADVVRTDIRLAQEALEKQLTNINKQPPKEEPVPVSTHAMETQTDNSE